MEIAFLVIAVIGLLALSGGGTTTVIQQAPGTAWTPSGAGVAVPVQPASVTTAPVMVNPLQFQQGGPAPTSTAGLNNTRVSPIRGGATGGVMQPFSGSAVQNRLARPVNRVGL